MKLVCPLCKLPFECLNSNELICLRCNKKFKIMDGVYVFTDEEETWVEDSSDLINLKKIVSKQEFMQINNNIQNKYKYVFDKQRTDWLFHCLNPRENERCLDIGSGFGTISFILSKWYNETWSLEKSVDRIEFQKIIMKEEDNVSLTRCDMLNLPFPNNSFNLVCLNGVLEWAGLANPNINPQITQLDLLLEIQRILKDRGCLYIGIENRFGIQNFLGGQDHGDLPFTSILPRFISNFICRIFKKGRYLTYTHSYLEYKKLLKKAGYNYIDFYWVMPGYHYPTYSAKIDDVDSYKLYLRFLRQRTNKLLKKLILSLLFISPKPILKIILKFFCPEYLIFAYKNRGDTLENAILRDMDADKFLKVSGEMGYIDYYIINKNNDVEKIIKIPRFKHNNKTINDNGRVIKNNYEKIMIYGLELFMYKIKNNNIHKS